MRRHPEFLSPRSPPTRAPRRAGCFFRLLPIRKSSSSPRASCQSCRRCQYRFPPELHDTHRPGEFRIKRFFHSRMKREGEEGRARNRHSSGADEPAARRPATGCRIFRPRLPARVELREGCPVKIFFRGLYGRVVTASGPWRTSGEWSAGIAWQQEIGIWRFSLMAGMRVENRGLACESTGECAGDCAGAGCEGVHTRGFVLRLLRCGVPGMVCARNVRLKMNADVHGTPCAVGFQISWRGLRYPRNWRRECAERGMAAMALLDRDEMRRDFIWRRRKFQCARI